ncbi:uncharacterized protein RCC_09496 [Ramularia collo-cygni]|uniref:Uncharacterized protein n=1 Tax=Ramularia collo-cygni TaxID=112498 RepID=A0A2D3VF86_9PEZI|nr:uncharacterized protein RCC_09496 [Ramularia collo-cygni]CZT23782.1 uncharacterized protein RCC_09496 [Ramularia collo-cygni]
MHREGGPHDGHDRLMHAADQDMAQMGGAAEGSGDVDRLAHETEDPTNQEDRRPIKKSEKMRVIYLSSETEEEDETVDAALNPEDEHEVIVLSSDEEDGDDKHNEPVIIAGSYVNDGGVVVSLTKEEIPDEIVRKVEAFIEEITDQQPHWKHM